MQHIQDLTINHMELEPIRSEEFLQKRYEKVHNIETRIIALLKSFINTNTAGFDIVSRRSWRNYCILTGVINASDSNASKLDYEHIYYNRAACRRRLAAIVFVLSEAHRLLLLGGRSTFRELFYKAPMLTNKKVTIDNAVYDVCNILQAYHWKLGIMPTTKGIISGAMRIYMKSGDIVSFTALECQPLLPIDFSTIARIVTDAKSMLIVEKDAIFKRITKQLFNAFGTDVLLVTSKGYPDVTTRLLVHYLNGAFNLPVYILVDADPHGIEIMLTYRYGSRAMAQLSNVLNCKKLTWIGIHPSELNTLAIPTIPFTVRDHKKTVQLLQRNYLGAEIKKELSILLCVQRKAHIEDVMQHSIDFLISDYIPNKIRRNLVI